MTTKQRVGRPCCGCTGNLGEPNVKFIACIAGRSIVIACECSCHVVKSG